ncbi:MAG: hypothetical protein WDW38_007471 [Sanguina aurantia]
MLLPVESRIHGDDLQTRLGAISHAESFADGGDASTPLCSPFPKGTRVWVKMTGYCLWPGVVWSFSDCHPAEKPDVVEHVQGRCLVYFYGSAEHSWVPPGAVQRRQQQQPSGAVPDCCTQGHLSRRGVLAAVADEGTTATHAASGQGGGGGVADVGSRRAAAGSSMGRGVAGDEAVAGSEAAAGGSSGEAVAGRGVTTIVAADCGTRDALKLDALTAWGKKHSRRRRSRYFDTPTCAACVEQGAQLRCRHCHCHVHALCLTPPALTERHLPGDWRCPKCQKSSGEAVTVSARNPEEGDLAGAAAIAAEERLGLTPDWIIHAAAYDVFQLPRPSLAFPYIRGLLDPCTNNKVSCARFKDYEKSPIGFGVVVFCVAKACSIALFQRFMAAFGGAGEANMPIDAEMVASPAFASLLTRLKSQAEQFQRDHWVQCSLCDKWRIIPYAQSGGLLPGQRWQCSQLRPPHSSCATPQHKHERDGLPFTQAALADAEAEARSSAAAAAAAAATGAPTATAATPAIATAPVAAAAAAATL